MALVYINISAYDYVKLRIYVPTDIHCVDKLYKALAIGLYLNYMKLMEIKKSLVLIFMK